MHQAWILWSTFKRENQVAIKKNRFLKTFGMNNHRKLYVEKLSMFFGKRSDLRL